jgi:hypothetical protein
MDNSPRDARKAEDRPKGTVIRDFFPRFRDAVGVCDLLLLGLLLVGAGTTALSCSYRVTVVTENPQPTIHYSHLGPWV